MSVLSARPYLQDFVSVIRETGLVTLKGVTLLWLVAML
nr:hypothetical protein [uncultured bacterium]